MSTILQIFDNLVLLSFLGLSYLAIERSRNWLGDFGAPALIGLSFGFITFLVTATPVHLGDGATIDARAGPVILAGLFAGPVGALIAASLGAVSRWIVGGGFAASGMVVFFVYSLIGVAAKHFRIVTPATVTSLNSIAMLTAASWMAASAMFLIIRPVDRAVSWIQQDLPYIFLANALSVAFASLAIGLAIGFLRKSNETIELGETLNLAKRAGKFGIWDFDVRSGVLKWDARSQELHGIDASMFNGTYEDWARNVHPDDLTVAQDAFALSLSNDIPFSCEYRVVLPDGGSRTIKGDAVVLRDRAGQALRVVGTNLDLSELRIAEAKLSEAQSIAAQSQKFETIGQLTGGVAHDFNNLLAVIMGNQELLKDELKRYPFDIEEANALIDASIEATKRGAELTGNMLSYARKAHLSPVLTDLNEVVRETDAWLRRTIESSVEIQTVLQAGLWHTLVDRASMQSALVNLLVNARDALAGTGKVTVETRNVRLETDQVENRREDILAGRYVMLAVTDTGPGIAPEQIDRIFDPFFTTKPTGKGSGLGLSMVQGFVKQSNGAIRFSSEPGVGTRFKLYFPAADGVSREGPVAEALPPPPATSRMPTKRVLVVEDDKQVLAILKKTLVGAGYDVRTAESGDEAMVIFRDDRRFDLVVSDIVMPGRLQGPALAKEIRALHPEMGFIFLSGYASEATVHGNGVRPSDIRLMKPVSRRGLLDAVESALACVALD